MSCMFESIVLSNGRVWLSCVSGRKHSMRSSQSSLRNDIFHWSQVSMPFQEWALLVSSCKVQSRVCLLSTHARQAALKYVFGSSRCQVAHASF